MDVDDTLHFQTFLWNSEWTALVVCARIPSYTFAIMYPGCQAQALEDEAERTLDRKDDLAGRLQRLQLLLFLLLL